MFVPENELFECVVVHCNRQTLTVNSQLLLLLLLLAMMMMLLLVDATDAICVRHTTRCSHDNNVAALRPTTHSHGRGTVHSAPGTTVLTRNRSILDERFRRQNFSLHYSFDGIWRFPINDISTHFI